MARIKGENSLADRIGDKLEEAGFERKPGTNEFSAPENFGSTDSPVVDSKKPGGADLPPAHEGTNSGVVAADQLRLFIERIERLEEEKQGIADDVKDTYAESKASGYDTKTMRTIVRLRKMEKHTRDEADMLLDTYKIALGMA